MYYKRHLLKYTLDKKQIIKYFMWVNKTNNKA